MSKKSTKGDESKMIDSLLKVLQDLTTKIPKTREKASENPKDRSKTIVRNAAIKAAGVAGTMAIPPGLIGFITILPDLVAVWGIQRQMVVDIATAFGKKATLTQSQMIYCLFKHSAGQAVRDLLVRTGQRVIIKRTTLRFIQTVLKKIGVRVLQRTTSRVLARWLPVIGVVGISAYAYYDTAQVGKTSIYLFSKEVVVEKE